MQKMLIIALLAVIVASNIAPIRNFTGTGA